MKNYVNLIGRIGQDPDIKIIGTEHKVAKFSLATSEKRKDKNGEYTEQTEWHTIILWNNLANLAEKFLQKGSLIDVTGSIHTRSYEKDGSTRYITEIVGRSIVFLSKKEEQKTQNETSFTNTTPEDDLPF